MAKKVYRTAQGKKVDMGAVLLRNEKVRAVGNMGVNARGDQIDRNNNPIESKNSKVNRAYARQSTHNVSDTPVVDSSKVIYADEDPMGPMDEPIEQQAENKDDGFSLT
jgi:deoxycytidylate deaminase